MNLLWKKLLTKDVLLKGWHLARADTRLDFAEDLYSIEAYALNIDSEINEILNRLITGTYQPNHLFRIEVPKGSLGVRPGAVISIQDRVVIAAIIYLIAETADKNLPDSVYSWRTKKPFPKKGVLFVESDITSIPFLKNKTISKRFDPFLSWYNVWPVFDKKSRNAYITAGYRFLATSDISAYFENIQLPILRDALLKIFPTETKIINLLFTFLEAWTVKTSDGRAQLRGIPQGNFISSFLGNIFLLPLDLKFKDLEDSHEIKYFRYMDDVRIFTKNIEDARISILLMDRELKKLHLNIQTAKTKILDHKKGDINLKLIDERVDKLSTLIEDIQKKIKIKPLTKSEIKIFKKQIDAIANTDLSARQKILTARRPLNGLDLRAFIRWIHANNIILNDSYVDRLLKEIRINPEQRLTRKLTTATRKFPNKPKIERSVLAFLQSKKNIFPHQEAECLRALRYLCHIHQDLIDHCTERVLNIDYDPYVRMQSAYLLSRTEVDHKIIKDAEDIFDIEKNPYIQGAISTILSQKRKNSDLLIRKLMFHPNAKISNLGKLYRSIRNDEAAAVERLNHIFRKDNHWILCDNMPFIHLMSNCFRPEIRKLLLDAIRKPRNTVPIYGLRNILKSVFTRTRESLKSSTP